MIIDLWKPYGITSIQFVKDYKLTNSIKKATCVGKLDPLAQGQLKILTENDTKQMSKYLKYKKRYRFDLILGIETESHDCLSNIIEIISYSNNNNTLYTDINNFIKNYVLQKIPLVSSYILTKDGIKNPLWWFYTNGYRNIKLPTKEVKIFEYKIHSIHISDFYDLCNNFINRIKTITNKKLTNELNTFKIKNEWSELQKIIFTKHIIINLEMTVSSGFYIRRFCHDFGKYLNTSAIAHNITRLNIME